MILWLNGPYGVGKSTLAEALHVALPDSFVFDAEQIGNAIRDNMPEDFFRATFEEYPLWQDTCVRLLTEISSKYSGHILVPMTLMHFTSIDLFDRIRQVGTEIRHVLLMADKEEVHRRILERGEEVDCWCARQTACCLQVQGEMPCDMRLDASETPENLANTLIHAFQL